jgi:vitamin K-dependent gamma-carboxylase
LLRQHTVVALMSVYLSVQLLVPFRHILYPGVVHWTEEGHRWSWHMKLRSKDCRGAFFVTETASGATHIVVPERFLEEHQVRKSLGRPDMALQFAHFLRDRWREHGYEVEVRAKIRCSLNGRPHQVFIDPGVDLAAEPRTLRHATWILPLRTELED